MKLLKNKYKIEKVLGQGAMGRVFLATDVQSNQKVAVKEIVGSQGVTEKAIKRFKREYQFLSAINHRNVIKAHDFFSEQQRLFLVLEYVTGIDLSEFIKQKPKSLTLQKQLAIAIQITRGVEVLNTAGILHRDIKPANIMIDEQKKLAKILDLGIGKSKEVRTKLTKDGAMMGTPSYMSPEQVDGKITPSSDVFSIGVSLYQFFLWEPKSPFHSKNMVNTVHRIVTEELPRLDSKLGNFLTMGIEGQVYERLSNLIDKAVQKEHKNRLSTKGLADGLTEIYQILDKSRTETFVNNEINLNDLNEDGIVTQMWCPTMTLNKSQEVYLKKLGKQYSEDIESDVSKETLIQESLGSKKILDTNERTGHIKKEQTTGFFSGPLKIPFVLVILTLLVSLTLNYFSKQNLQKEIQKLKLKKTNKQSERLKKTTKQNVRTLDKTSQELLQQQKKYELLLKENNRLKKTVKQNVRTLDKTSQELLQQQKKYELLEKNYKALRKSYLRLQKFLKKRKSN